MLKKLWTIFLLLCVPVLPALYIGFSYGDNRYAGIFLAEIIVAVFLAKLIFKKK